MGTSPTRELVILAVRAQNFVSPTALPLFNTSQAHKPEDLVQCGTRSCYSSHPRLSTSHHAALPWPLCARRVRDHPRLVRHGPAGSHAAISPGLGGQANVHLLYPVPWRPSAIHLGPAHRRPADCERSQEPGASHSLRAHV